MDHPVIISDQSAGRNGVDSPVSSIFPSNQCVEALNVDFRNGGLGRKRGGLYDAWANTTHTGAALMTTPVYSLLRHTPTGNETEGEVWAFENAIPGATPRIRLSTSTTWATPSSGKVFQSRIQDVQGVSFNGKLHLLYDSADDRSKVWDPDTDTIRNSGLAAPAAPTAANTGAGAYAIVGRYYRQRFVHIVSGATVRVSEPSAAIFFVPSGAGTAARVTKSATISEGETHWRIEASADGLNYYILATVVVGTTTYDDSAAVSTYSANELTEITGTYTLIPSVKYGITDGNRFIGVAAWETGKGSRVIWTEVLGSLNRGDDERIFQTATVKPYLDLDDKNGGDATGIGQINGVIYVFKYRQVWRLSPTGNPNAPYQARRISGVVGSVSHKSIALGEDTSGNPCLYFMSHRGPYRVGANGIEYIGRDIEDITRTSSGLPNINTVATIVVSHSVFHADMWQWWVWFSTGANNSPNELFVLDVKKATRRDEYGVRGGWSRMSGEIATAVCSCMGNYTLAATAALRPWIGIFHATDPIIAICDRDDMQTDRGTPFQAYIKTKSVGDPETFGTLMEIRECILIASHNTATGFTLQLSLDRNFGLEVPVFYVVPNTADINKRIISKFADAHVADAAVLQIQIGDSAAVLSQWQLDELKLTLHECGEL